MGKRKADMTPEELERRREVGRLSAMRRWEGHVKKVKPPKSPEQSLAERRRKVGDIAMGLKTGNNRDKPVLCIDDMIYYASIAEAADAVSTTRQAVWLCVRGQTKTCTGKQWRYATMEEYGAYLRSKE